MPRGTIKVGEQFMWPIFGKETAVELVAVHDFGTIDLKLLSSGRHFRQTGLREPLPFRPAPLLEAALTDADDGYPGSFC